MKAIHIVADPPLYTNTFLLIGDKGHAVAVDPQAAPEKYIKALEEAGATLSLILLTHGHHDHIAGVDPLREKYGAKMMMNAADAAHFGLRPDDVYTDLGTLTVDDMTFETIFTPGHTPGSTVIRCGDLLFAGDTLFAGDIGRTDLPGGDPAEMRRSLRKLREHIAEDVQVLPGHEEFSTLEQEKAHNAYLRDA